MEHAAASMPGGVGAPNTCVAPTIKFREAVSAGGIVPRSFCSVACAGGRWLALKISPPAPLNVVERAVDRPLEFNGTHITAGRLAQARGLGGDGLIVLCEFGSQLFRVGARALDDFLRVLAGRGKFAIPVPIDTDGIGGAEDAWLPDQRTGLIRLRDWPERSRNGRSGRNGDEMNVVGGFGDHPDDARLFDRAERRFDPLLADS